MRDREEGGARERSDGREGGGDGWEVGGGVE